MLRRAICSKRPNITKYKNKLKVIARVLWDYIIPSFMYAFFCFYLFVVALIITARSLKFFSPSHYNKKSFVMTSLICRFFSVQQYFSVGAEHERSILKLVASSIRYNAREKKSKSSQIHSECSGVLCRFYSESLGALSHNIFTFTVI